MGLSDLSFITKRLIARSHLFALCPMRDDIFSNKKTDEEVLMMGYYDNELVGDQFMILMRHVRSRC